MGKTKILQKIMLLFLLLIVKESLCYCPSGTIVSSDGKTCKDCPVGVYSEGYASSCKKCKAGYVAANNNGDTGKIRSNQCYHCNGGYYTDDNIICKDCPVGTYSEGYASSCKKCKAGHVAANNNGDTGKTRSNQCYHCNGGYYTDDNTICKDCPVGTYSEGYASSCKKCKAGHVAVNGNGDTGKIRSSQCYHCNGGYYTDDNITCKKCPNEGCPKIFIPDDDNTISKLIKSRTFENSKNFLKGMIYGYILEDKVNIFKEIKELPSKFKETEEAWGNVTWTNGASILKALRLTSSTMSSTYDILEDTKVIEKLKTAVEGAVAVFAPELVLVYEAGFYSYRLYKNSVDITHNVRGLYNNLKAKNFEEAGRNLGRLIKDATELKKQNDEGKHQMQKLLFLSE